MFPAAFHLPYVQTRPQWLLFVATVSLGICAFLPGESQGSLQSTHGCRPPRGPGDNLVHSSDLRARGVDCATAREVVLASTKGPPARFSEGAPFDAAGFRWRCTATPFPSAHQRCTADPDKLVSIVWGD